MDARHVFALFLRGWVAFLCCKRVTRHAILYQQVQGGGQAVVGIRILFILTTVKAHYQGRGVIGPSFRVAGLIIEQIRL